MRKNIYLTPEALALLKELSKQYEGNESRTIHEGLKALKDDETQKKLDTIINKLKTLGRERREMTGE